LDGVHYQACHAEGSASETEIHRVRGGVHTACSLLSSFGYTVEASDNAVDPDDFGVYLNDGRSSSTP
jgi:hypothetical protein